MLGNEALKPFPIQGASRAALGVLSHLSLHSRNCSASRRLWLSIPGGSRAEHKAPALPSPCWRVQGVPVPRKVWNPSAFGPGDFIRDGSRCLLLTAPAQPSLSVMELGILQGRSQTPGGKKHPWLSEIPFFPRHFGVALCTLKS